MTIFEYIQNWSNEPWLNTDEYTYLQIGLFFAGAVSWIVCYADTIYCMIKKKTVNIPIAAVTLNFGWEMAACFFFVPNMGKVLVLAYWAWMLLDVVIFSSLFRYGHKQMQVPYFRERIKYFLIIGILLSFFSQLFYMLQYDLPMAPITGYIINIVMSMAFLYLLFVRGFEGNSLVTAWSKFLGTFFVSIMFWNKYAQNNFLIVMYIGVAMFDIMYIALLYKKNKGGLT
jgi:hypothetical protein